MTAPINPATVAMLHELDDAATPAPWAADEGYCSDGPWVSKADAALIAAMRNTLPALLDQLDAQAAEIERLRAELAVERQCRNGHLPDCAGIDLEQMRCGCGYLDGTAYRSLADEIERLKAECIREHDREFAPFCEQSERADKAKASVKELESELAEARKLEAVCHCGVPLRDHETENHGAVEMKHPCPNADRVAELDELLRKHALRECAECMGTGSYLGDEDRNGPCDACGGTGRVLPGEVSAVLAKREGGR